MSSNEQSSALVSLPGRLGQVVMDGELPRRDQVGLVFDELDYQMACQAYLWALPLVSYAQWQSQHREVFGATDYDLVHYVSYRDRLGLITANATTPYILTFIDLSRTGPLVVELPAGPDRRRAERFLAAGVRGHGRDGPRARRRRQASGRAARHTGAAGRRVLLRPSGHRHQHHVRIPHAGPRSGPGAGAGRAGADHLPGRPGRTRHPNRVPGRPGLGRGPAPRAGLLGSAARHLPAGDRRRTRPLLPGHAPPAGHREGQTFRARTSGSPRS